MGLISRVASCGGNHCATIATQTMMMLRRLPSASLSRVASLPRAASLGVPAARRLCMHDDFKPKVRSYAADGEEASVHAQIEKDVAANKVVVFMKGVPDQPQCGFSNTVVQILKAEGTSFKGFNVLADPDLREGIKSYSNWPTIPQARANAAQSPARSSTHHFPLGSIGASNR